MNIKYDLYVIDEKTWKRDVIKFFQSLDELLSYLEELTKPRDSFRISVHNIRYELF